MILRRMMTNHSSVLVIVENSIERSASNIPRGVDSVEDAMLQKSNEALDRRVHPLDATNDDALRRNLHRARDLDNQVNRVFRDHYGHRGGNVVRRFVEEHPLFQHLKNAAAGLLDGRSHEAIATGSLALALPDVTVCFFAHFPPDFNLALGTTGDVLHQGNDNMPKERCWRKVIEILVRIAVNHYHFPESGRYSLSLLFYSYVLVLFLSLTKLLLSH